MPTELTTILPPTADIESSAVNAATVEALLDAPIPKPLPPVRAAASTVEALMYSLRERGAAALSERVCRDRLAGLSSDQVRSVIARLIEMRPRYPNVTDDLLFKVGEQL